MQFADPLFLLLLIGPAAYVGWAWRTRRIRPERLLAFPVLRFLPPAAASLRVRWRRSPEWLKAGGLILLTLALARPQVAGKAEPTRLRSRNIIVALDISSSMKATDFQPGNRLMVAREVLREFVKRRRGDLVGLVIFAGRAYLQAPLTTDVDVLDRLVEQVDIGLLPDGTAIGTALAMSLNQLKNLPAKACTVVLITDGANNTGEPTPAVAAEAARALGIRVHAIGLSSSDTTQTWLNGVWSVRSLSPRLTGRDEAALRTLAARTGGQYYRATDPEALERIIAEIDPLERIEVEVNETRRYRELFPWVLSLGLVLSGAGLALESTWLRRVP
jgi:Ca-activated chloride channel family protein